VTVHDEIFPSYRSLDFVQTEWSKDWFGVASGFEYAAQHLTANRHSFGAAIDAVGLAIFYLQRHRVEIALKAILRDFKAEVSTHHFLRALWKQVGAAFRARDKATWVELNQAHAPLIVALDRVDPGSFTFRYPVSADGTTVERPLFIDLDALERHVTRFVNDSAAAVDWVSEDWE
jgi:hypothetical protein